MSITSLGFVAFFVIIFLIYWLCLREKKKEQNILLLIASYVFYSFADWRMSFLILASTIFFYVLGIYIAKTIDKKPKLSTFLTIVGFITGIGLLFYFKYLNFFVDGLSDFIELFGFHTGWVTKVIIFPLGVSYFSFKFISYIYEISQENIEAEKNFISFATYISFFPTITAGPIDRPQTFLPQLNKTRIFDYSLAVDGCRQILWGLFKKMVVADNIAPFVNDVFGNYQNLPGSTLLLAAILYSFQIYADFSGYSDMAIGVSKLLGFKVTKNFNFPFFAQNIAEFWRKWHMSLTEWLTDYVFKTLSFKWRTLGKLGIIFAIIANFLLCGLWHGASWNFVVFGLYHGLLFIPLILSGTMLTNNKNKIYPDKFHKLKALFKILLTFFLVTLGFIVARTVNIEQTFEYLSGLTNIDLASTIISKKYLVSIFFIFFMLIVEWLQRNKQHGLELANIKSHIVKFAIYTVLVAIIFMFGGTAETFIYFQF
jgi:D-alanyl-lipoteichoic acid acyltransferase DltB (MBOAT superfamily)